MPLTAAMRAAACATCRATHLLKVCLSTTILDVVLTCNKREHVHICGKVTPLGCPGASHCSMPLVPQYKVSPAVDVVQEYAVSVVREVFYVDLNVIFCLLPRASLWGEQDYSCLAPHRCPARSVAASLACSRTATRPKHVMTAANMSANKKLTGKCHCAQQLVGAYLGNGFHDGQEALRAAHSHASPRCLPEHGQLRLHHLQMHAASFQMSHLHPAPKTPDNI